MKEGRQEKKRNKTKRERIESQYLIIYFGRD